MSADANRAGGTSTWDAFQRVAVVVAVVASVATFVGVWMQLRPSDPVVELRTLSVERLTTQADLPGFQSQIQYGDRVLSDLWKIRVRLTNPGPIVLLTTGPRQNVLGEGLTLRVTGGREILEVVREVSGFPHRVTHDSLSTIAIRFIQWRVTEFAEYSVYVTSPEPIDTAPQLVMSDRLLVDGVVTRLAADGESTAGSMLLGLPRPFALAGRILGGILAGIGVVLAAYALLGGTLEYARVGLWQWKTRAAFQRFVEDPDTRLPRGFSTDAAKSHLLESPWRLPSEYWDSFDGPQFPVDSPSVEDLGGWVVWTIVWGLGGVSCLALFAGVLPPL